MLRHMAISYRSEIDGLRAIAVIAVVLYHTGLGIAAAGFVGVDVFFVISGYLITAILLREAQSGHLSLAAFYARRIRRILPAMMTVVVTVLIASAFVLSPIGQQPNVAKSAIAALSLVANLFFQLNSGGYFDSSADEMALLHLWSLSVEEQFYLVWPLFLVGLHKRGPRQLLLGISVLAIGSFALAKYLSTNAAFFQMPARFWELAVGGLCAAIPLDSQPKPLVMGLSYAGLTAVLWTILAPNLAFSSLGTLPAVGGTAALLYAIRTGEDLGLAGTFLRARIMVFFGLISYSLYLWHWPLLALDKATRIGERPLATTLGYCIAAVSVAWLSYRFIETPCRKLKATNARTIMTGGASAAVVAGAALSVCFYAPRDDTTKLAIQAMFDHPDMRCHYGAEDTNRPRCPTDGARVVIWGDSYGLAWRPFAERLGPTASFTRDGCSPIIGEQHDSARGQLCAEFRQSARKEIEKLAPQVVILAARWTGYDLTGLADTLRTIAAPTVIVIGPTPQMKRRVSECIERHVTDKCGVTRAEFEDYAGVTRSRLKLITESVGAEFLDPTDYFCSNKRCPTMKEGRALYWDDDHVASSAVQEVVANWLSTRTPSR